MLYDHFKAIYKCENDVKSYMKIYIFHCVISNGKVPKIVVVTQEYFTIAV